MPSRPTSSRSAQLQANPLTANTAHSRSSADINRLFSLNPLLNVAVAVLMLGSCALADDTRAKERENYELMSLFVETFQQIESNYVRDVDRRELMEAAIQGMLSHLDQYSNYIPPQDVSRFNQMVEQEFGGIGITVNARQGQLIVVSPLPGTPAYRAGIRAGDIIVEVEGKSTDGITLSEAVGKLQGPVGRPVKLRIQHPEEGSEPEDVELIRELIKAPTVLGNSYNDKDQWEFMYDTERRIGYIRLSHFSRYTADELKAAIDSLVERDVQGLILDLRFNPGGLLEAAIEIADMFLEKGTIVSVRGRNVPERSWSAKKSGTYPQFPIAVLVNNYSASASEVLSACLQDNHRAVVIGERTWGKGSVQNVIRMEGGDSALKLTTASYHRPSGVNIHRFPDMTPKDQWGVTPDEGFVIPYDRRQWAAWDRDRKRRDVLRRASVRNGSDNSSTADEDSVRFEDTQLQAAIDYIVKKLEGTSKDSETKQPPDSATSTDNATTTSESPKDGAATTSPAGSDSNEKP